MLLAVSILTTGIFGSYQTAQAAEIVAGYTALEVIEGILLSFGISLFTTEMITTLTEDPETAQDEYWRETQAAFWADQMEAEYENQRKNGNGSGPTPTPGPTGAEIPSFKEVIQNMKNSGKIVLGAAAGAGVWECMSKAVSSLWDKIMGNEASDYDVSQNPYISKRALGRCRISTPINNSYVNTNDYWLYTDVSGDIAINFDSDSFDFTVCTILSDGTLEPINYYYYELIHDNKYVGSRSGLVKSGYWVGGITSWAGRGESTFDNYFNCPLYVNGVLSDSYPPKTTKENIWVHPDLEETYKNNGKLEYPQQAPQPLQIPSIDQLTELANKLKSDPDQSPDAVQELIDQLKQNSTPQPTTAPNPNPDPQPTTIPNPTISPDISDGTDTDIDPNKYKTDLRLVFPFCIPFDLVHLIQAFEAEPKAPVFEFPVDMELTNPFTEKKILDYHHTFELDMSDFEPVIKILRIFEIIFFIIGLLMITRQQMIKG